MLTQATHLTVQTNTAYHKMGHLIGAAKRWDISAAYCAHTSNTSNSTNKHTVLTQATHLSQHKQTQSITRWVIRYKPPKDGASQQHTVLTHPTQTQSQASHPGCGSCQSKQEPSKRCPTDVPYSTLHGVGATNHNTLSPLHAQDTSVL